MGAGVGWRESGWRRVAPQARRGVAAAAAAWSRESRRAGAHAGWAAAGWGTGAACARAPAGAGKSGAAAVGWRRRRHSPAQPDARSLAAATAPHQPAHPQVEGAVLQAEVLGGVRCGRLRRLLGRLAGLAGRHRRCWCWPAIGGRAAGGWQAAGRACGMVFGRSRASHKLQSPRGALRRVESTAAAAAGHDTQGTCCAPRRRSWRQPNAARLDAAAHLLLFSRRHCSDNLASFSDSAMRPGQAGISPTSAAISRVPVGCASDPQGAARLRDAQRGGGGASCG